jgi:hypothetical protein
MAYPNGCIYQRPKSPFWWAKIVPYKGARAIFESTKRTRKDHAETYLKERLKDYQMDLGHVRPEQVTFNELAEDLKTDYRIQGRKSFVRLETSVLSYKFVDKLLPFIYGGEKGGSTCLQVVHLPPLS